MEIMKLTIKGDFHRGTCYLSTFSYHKITLFEKKCVIKFITLTSMYHLKPLVSLQAHLKLLMHVQISKLLLVLTLLNPFNRKIL